MAGYDVAAVQEVLKIDYAPVIVEMYKRENVLYDLLMQGDKSEIRGKKLYIPYELNRDPSGAPGGENDPYPDPGVPEWGHFEPSMTFYRGRFRVTTAVEDDTKNGDLAYIRGIERSLRGAVDGLKGHQGQDLYGTRRGALAVLGAVCNATPTATLRDGWVTSLEDEMGSRYLLKGQLVQIVSTSGGAPPYTYRLSATGKTYFQVSSRPNTIQVTFTENVVAGDVGDIIVRKGSFDITSGIGKALMGMDEIIDDGTIAAELQADYGAIDRSALPEIDSWVANMGGDPLNSETLDDAFSGVHAMSGEVMTPENTVWICDRSVRNVIKDWKDGQRIFAPKVAPLGTDTKSLTYNPGEGDFPIHVDKMCRKRTLFMINRQFIEVYQNIPIELQNVGGTLHLYRDSNGNVYDVVEGFLHARVQVFSRKPHAHAKVVNIGGTRAEYGKLANAVVFPPA